MRFTLNYDGPLPARGNAEDKRKIRSSLHHQLVELWTHPPLNGRLEWLTENDQQSVLHRVGDSVYASLVDNRLHLLAELNILMLRPERPGRIITSGSDLDNQLKTLFDALRRPQVQAELSDQEEPSSVEKPSHVLLDDDSLISSVSVRTDRLLASREQNHVRLTIGVHVYPHRLTYGSFGVFS